MGEKNTHLVYGMAAGIGYILISLVFHLMHKDDMPFLALLAFLPYLGFIIYNAFAYSKANDGYVTFGQAFWSCFRAVMIVTLLMIVWLYVFNALFPEAKEAAFEKAREQMANKPGMTDEQIDLAMNLAKKWGTTIAAGSTLFVSLIGGALLSVIAAAVAPKKGEKPIFDNL